MILLGPVNISGTSSPRIFLRLCLNSHCLMKTYTARLASRGPGRRMCLTGLWIPHRGKDILLRCPADRQVLSALEREGEGSADTQVTPTNKSNVVLQGFPLNRKRKASVTWASRLPQASALLYQKQQVILQAPGTGHGSCHAQGANSKQQEQNLPKSTCSHSHLGGLPLQEQGFKETLQTALSD